VNGKINTGTLISQIVAAGEDTSYSILGESIAFDSCRN